MPPIPPKRGPRKGVARATSAPATVAGPAATPSVAIGTNFRRQKYLLAFAAQPEVRNHLRTQAAKENPARVREIMDVWTRAQPRVQALMQTEAGLLANSPLSDLPAEHHQRVERMLDSDLFRKTFQHQTMVAMVEIDRLIAPQRTVDLDYVDQIAAAFPEDLTDEALIRICLSLEREMAPIQHLELAASGTGSMHVFSSPSFDLRFLGAFVKELTPEDLSFAEWGGIPAAAIISFVGYGASPVNVFYAGTRAVLNNGFHRVYALRSRGVEKIPVVVQLAHNVPMEFPPQVAGLPREYLLGYQRPVLMKDFFEADLSVVMNVQRRMRVVQIHVSAGAHDVPS